MSFSSTPAAAVFTVLAFFYASARMPALSAGQAIVLILIAFETGGGLVALFTPGTAAYYGTHAPLRWALLVAQLVQPGLLALLFGGRIVYWVFLYVYAIAAAVLSGLPPQVGRRRVIAAALVGVGIVALLPIGASLPGLAWFAPVYLVKVILGLSARAGGGRLMAKLRYLEMGPEEHDLDWSITTRVMRDRVIMSTLQASQAQGEKHAVIAIVESGELLETYVSPEAAVLKAYPFDPVRQAFDAYDPRGGVCLLIVRDDAVAISINGLG